MSIILIGGEKGGTGKSSIATNLAALRALAGRDVLLVDTDVQASASFWVQTRDEAGVKPRVACIQKFGNGLRAEVMDLAGRYQDILIDAGGRDSVELRAALIVAEHAFIPIQASQFDVWTLSRVNELVKTARSFNSGLLAYIVLSRISPNPSVTEQGEAEEVIRDFEDLELAQSVIRDRIAYRKAARDGLCVAELRPADPKAVEEVRALFAEVFGNE